MSFNIGIIEYALREAEHHAALDHSREGRDRARACQIAIRELELLSRELPNLLALKQDADRAYDSRAHSDYDRCFCHLAAPCNYCIEQSQEEDEG